MSLVEESRYLIMCLVGYTMLKISTQFMKENEARVLEILKKFKNRECVAAFKNIIVGDSTKRSAEENCENMVKKLKNNMNAISDIIRKPEEINDQIKRLHRIPSETERLISDFLQHLLHSKHYIRLFRAALWNILNKNTYDCIDKHLVHHRDARNVAREDYLKLLDLRKPGRVFTDGLRI